MTERADNWAETRASWDRLRLAFAGYLHALADNIETRVTLARLKRKSGARPVEE